MAIGWISATVIETFVARHHHFGTGRQFDRAGHVGGAEVELRTVAVEERV